MVWITKREIAYYIILKHVFKDKPFNIGEALDILSILGSRAVARKIIKRLVSRGFIQRIDITTYRVKEFENVLLTAIREYIIERMIRSLKSRGFDIEKNIDGSISIHNCDNRISSAVLNMFKDLIMFKCLNTHENI